MQKHRKSRLRFCGFFVTENLSAYSITVRFLAMLGKTNKLCGLFVIPSAAKELTNKE